MLNHVWVFLVQAMALPPYIYYAHLNPCMDPDGTGLLPNAIVIWWKEIQMDQDPSDYHICVINIIDIIATHLQELDAGPAGTLPNHPSGFPHYDALTYAWAMVPNFGLYTGIKEGFMKWYGYPHSYIANIWNGHSVEPIYSHPICDLTPPKVLKPLASDLPHKH